MMLNVSSLQGEIHGLQLIQACCLSLIVFCHGRKYFHNIFFLLVIRTVALRRINIKPDISWSSSVRGINGGNYFESVSVDGSKSSLCIWTSCTIIYGFESKKLFWFSVFIANELSSFLFVFFFPCYTILCALFSSDFYSQITHQQPTKRSSYSFSSNF